MGFDFTISEDALLKVSGVSAVAYCAFSTAAPKEFHRTFMAKTAPLSEEAWRYQGIAGLMIGADHLILSAKDGHKDVKKDMLKVAGAGWLACAAHNAYNGFQAQTQPREIATANAIGQAVLGSLCLWKGFE